MIQKLCWLIILSTTPRGQLLRWCVAICCSQITSLKKNVKLNELLCNQSVNKLNKRMPCFSCMQVPMSFSGWTVESLRKNQEAYTFSNFASACLRMSHLLQTKRCCWSSGATKRTHESWEAASSRILPHAGSVKFKCSCTRCVAYLMQSSWFSLSTNH